MIDSTDQSYKASPLSACLELCPTTAAANQHKNLSLSLELLPLHILL